jgi:S-formylglutathione hydrolase FrmB
MLSAGETVGQPQWGRRRFLGTVGSAALLATVGSLGLSGCDPEPVDGFGLTITDRSRNGRLRSYRFATDEIAWQPRVNVLVPADYGQSGRRRYPVVYWLHGGSGTYESLLPWLQDTTAGRELIVVMPDGGTAGWYSDPVHSNTGPRNWESFHMAQLLPWIDASFRTFAEPAGRAVAGFSMGGFGALKYAAKHSGYFSSVSSHSGPASIRRDGGLVVHWANTSSAATDLAGGSIYGVPLWNQARVSADNPVENMTRFHDKRIFLACGAGADVQENQVRAGHREFRGLLSAAGVPHEFHELDGTPHSLRLSMVQRDIDQTVAHLRPSEVVG